MTADELREKFINFFVEKGHKEIPSASLIPENDPSTLFISAGMHPLVPYLLGEPHPLGKRLCSIQKCLRTGDIDSVGDTYHHTFFEMMGNWSLGDYWKEEMIPWSFEFLTRVLNIPVEKISVTCFEGDSNSPKDEETALLWQKVGIPKERIYFLGKEDNWWGLAGGIGPCGPDSEMFFDTGNPKCGNDCRPGCSCGKYIEIWNNVFMMYNKTADGNLVPLKQKNIDTGMGVERTLAVLNGFDDDYKTELFWPIIKEIEKISGKKYDDFRRDFRVIADHLKAAVFIADEGIEPSNTDQGYILRRLARRAVRKCKYLGINNVFGTSLVDSVVDIYQKDYPDLEKNKQRLIQMLSEEEKKFQIPLNRIDLYRTDLEMAIKNKVVKKIKETPILTEDGKASGSYVYENYQSYGVPPDLSQEVVKELNLELDQTGYDEAFEKHKATSRIGGEKKFRGGMADHSEQVTKFHTATHLLHVALRQILGEEVHQVGSNITAERLRFDFTYPDKLTDEQLEKVETLVNEKISENLPVTMEAMSLEEAKEKGALAFFEQKYSEQVKVYKIGDFSMEVCGGPHVNSTGEIGKIKIIKEESCGAGKRRIYAVLT